MGRCAAVLGVISWIAFIEPYIYLAHTRPHRIDVAAGRVYSLNNHRSIAYLTRGEHLFMYAFAYAAGVFIIMSVVLYKGARAGNDERMKK